MASETFRVLWQCCRHEVSEMRQLGCPRRVPWDFVEPHEAQVRHNHDQTLARLHERGGLSPAEIVAVVTGRGLSFVFDTSDVACVPELLALLRTHAERQQGGSDGG